ncbi:SEA domain-containing protein [Balamuthia mandrillaris]
MEYCHNDTRYVGGCAKAFSDVKCGEISKEVVACEGTNMCAPSNFCPPKVTGVLDSNACYTPQCLLNDPSCFSPSEDLFHCADGTCAKEASECEHLVSPIITPLTKVYHMGQKEDLTIPFLSYDKGVFAGALRIPPGTFKQNTILSVQPMRYGEGDLYFSYPDYYADYVVYRAIVSSTLSLNASFEMGGRELEADEFHEPIEIYFQASRDVQKGERACVAYFDEELSAWVCLDDTTLASGDTSPQVYCGVTHHFTNFALLIGTIPDKEDGNDGDDESGFDSSSEVGSEGVSGAVLLPPGQLW